MPLSPEIELTRLHSRATDPYSALPLARGYHRAVPDIQALASENPFRTPEKLREGRELKLKAAQRSARGLKLLWVDAKVCALFEMTP